MSGRDPMTRRNALAAAMLGAGMTAAPRGANAQGRWPNRPIRLLVPFAAGGGTDVIARVLGSKLSVPLGQPVIADNRAGAAGIIATEAVAKAPPDGHTMLFASSANMANLRSGQTLPYDFEKDLAPIGQIGSTPTVIVVAQDSPIRSMEDLIARARSRPDTVSYGSAGVASFSHLATEMIAAEAQIRLVHVPYRGSAPAFVDLMAGRLTAVLASFASARTLLEGGKIRGIVVTGPERSAYAPALPTLAEVGLPGSTIEYWWGLMAPSGTPPAVVARLNAELNAALVQPDMREQLAREAAVATPGTPEAFGRLISAEVARWSRIELGANTRVE
ncbi:tripartite tricarboxylate transporter substrate binding protein [Muricoccus pecuniae]|uniref:Tripartite-type tricarboxylate transporter receptor subunit TctC n=1 Tax=Muricoccus pecuniae TaxID=693023 RepID=A0A840YC09_9PROT|nr:tripartite tricarboxylate transporter substrate binding protein [Roseomonas pecuniae]MBB5696239.1 tripartite-type tricarboxylate transporter receptor subunit TctC [Roseomonas pecuniae]